MILAGCAIAPYDLATDQGLSSIQTRVDQHLYNLQMKIPAPAGDFYGPLQNDLHSLSIRLGAREQGDPSVLSEQQALARVSAIVKDIDREETRATTRPVIDRVWQDYQSDFDTAIGSVLALELKRK